MKLVCETSVVNRNVPATRRGFQRTILAIGKNSEKKSDETVIMLKTTENKSGSKYELKGNISKIFTRFVSEGKATISFNVPEHDVQIKSEVIQLTTFLKQLKAVLSGEKPAQNRTNSPAATLGKLSCLSSVANMKSSVLSSTKTFSTKCVIRRRSDYPLKGFSRNLVTLQISDIKLIRFDPQILLLRSLRILNLSNNCIEKIPRELGQLNLTDIDLSGNALQNERWEWLLEPTIQNRLQNLNVGSNNLSYFPTNLVYSKGLVRLDLQRNHIQKLPFAVWKMAQLRLLNLSGNQIASVPESMVRMRLEQIDLSENNLSQNASTVQDLRMSSNINQVASLCELAARVVVARKIPYSPATIPFVLVEMMHRTPICGCGLLCFTTKIYERVKVVRLNCQQLIMNSNHMLYADCVFCSQRCSARS
ncbi:leucine-rich repeat protein 1 [Toxorhynchites rutilus septentrionalis]|uniref:leucine-rich repeat protein 1 n=1 Tax=Toxorhynchites rutilus septentrionalis TaxID=329112 RepID=UPI00247ADBD7|nr:leucine-rich repeat protein 1 [Toxorhynchites rutilus septentrionalis]